MPQKNMAIATLSNATHVYIDGRRTGWLLSTLLVLLPLAGIGLREAFGSDLWLIAPTVIIYVIVPILDVLIGEDDNNPARFLAFA